MASKLPSTTFAAKSALSQPGYSFIIDFAPVIAAVQFISDAGRSIDPKSGPGKKVLNSYFSDISELAMWDFHRFAAERWKWHAHVFEWEDIVDTLSGFAVTKVLTGKRLYDFVRDKNIKTSRNINKTLEIVFLNKVDDSTTFYDPLVYKEPIWGDYWSIHNFHDQAKNLERVAMIKKDSKVLSKRRLNAETVSKKAMKGARIVNLKTGGGLQNTKTMSRQNPYANSFDRSFKKYFTDQHPKMLANQLVPMINRGITAAFTQDLDDVAKQLNAASMRSAAVVSTSKKTTTATMGMGFRQIVINEGKPIAKMPTVVLDDNVVYAASVAAEMFHKAATDKALTIAENKLLKKERAARSLASGGKSKTKGSRVNRGVATDASAEADANLASMGGRSLGKKRSTKAPLPAKNPPKKPGSGKGAGSVKTVNTSKSSVPKKGKRKAGESKGAK